MNKIKLYRQRYIPKELILLKDDEIIYSDKNIIVTKWKVLKPRKDFSKGYSCYFINEGIKVSKMLKENNNFVYYYCDIIETEINNQEESYTFRDLLVDVVIYENGFVKVVDLGEIPIALNKNLITIEQSKKALEIVDSLLEKIYKNEFDIFTKILNSYIDKGEENIVRN